MPELSLFPVRCRLLPQELVNFSARWHGGLCASACNGDTRGSASKAGGGSGATAFHQPYGERAVEAITGANRVDGFDWERAHPFGVAIAEGGIAELAVAKSLRAGPSAGEAVVAGVGVGSAHELVCAAGPLAVAEECCCRWMVDG